MFRKLLKYDSRPLLRYWWIIIISVLGCTVVGAMATRFAYELQYNEQLKNLVSIMRAINIICIAVIIASIFVTFVLVFLRFYKNFFTDEGYLTFTLPVNRSTLLAAKTLNAFIWICLHFALWIICFLIYMMLYQAPNNGHLLNFEIFEEFSVLFDEMWQLMGAWSIIYTLLISLAGIGSLVYSISLVHFCITIGSVMVKKAKVMASIGIYYAVNTASNIIAYIFIFTAGIPLVSGFNQVTKNITDAQGYIVILLIILIFTAVSAVISAFMYCITLSCLERKLNLP